MVSQTPGMDGRIREATVDDVEAILALIVELADYDRWDPA